MNRALVIVVVVAGLLAGAGAAWLATRGGDAPPALEHATRFDAPRPLPAFSLVDQAGVSLGPDRLRGHWTFLFFGFVNCPDICPVELQTIGDSLDQLGAQAARVTPLFITVDPARDTPEALRDYVANFHPRLVALTGSAEAIGAVARAYRVFYAKATGTAAPEDPAAYILDHTAIVYLMGPDGGYLTHFTPGTAADAMAAGVRERL